MILLYKPCQLPSKKKPPKPPKPRRCGVAPVAVAKRPGEVDLAGRGRWRVGESWQHQKITERNISIQYVYYIIMYIRCIFKASNKEKCLEIS